MGIERCYRKVEFKFSILLLYYRIYLTTTKYYYGKIMYETLVAQWKIDCVHHEHVVVPAWEAKCEEGWPYSSVQRRPPYPTRSERPSKPKQHVLSNLSTVVS